MNHPTRQNNTSNIPLTPVSAQGNVSGRPALPATPPTSLGSSPNSNTRPRPPIKPNPSPAAARPQTPLKQWRAKSLIMTSTILTEIGLIVTIIYLARRSATNNGVTSVPQPPSPVSGRFDINTVWNYGLLWTVFPTFVLTVFKIAWDSIVDDSIDRQPFVELARGRSRPASAKKTILLDYGSYSSFISWLCAFRNGHILLSFAMLLRLLFSVVVIPLSAYLFFQAPSQSISATNISLTTTFNESAVTATVSMQPAIDLATSTRVYNGNPPAWMTLEYAFESFDTSLSNGHTTANITHQNATAYSAYLDCQIYNASFASNSDDTISYSMNDRGCDVSGSVNLDSSHPHTYAQSWTNLCTNTSNGNHRLGMLAGIYSKTSPLNLANFSLVSCIPSYWQKSGPLTVSIYTDSSPQFVSFVPSIKAAILPFSYQTIEDNLHFYTFFDPSRTIVADALGASILSYAGTLNSSAPMTPDVIKNATEDMFTTTYAGLAHKIMLQPAETTRVVSGEAILSIPVTRLYVTMPLAYTIVAVLFLILGCNVGLFVYAIKHPILVEEPSGLFGYATLLLDSNIFDIVSDALGRARPAKKTVTEFVSEKYTVETSKCYLEKNGAASKITIDGLKKP